MLHELWRWFRCSFFCPWGNKLDIRVFLGGVEYHCRSCDRTWFG